jgi:uroporphyrinogen-III synthase
MLQLLPLAEPGAPQRQLLLDLDLYTHVIFVSTNAVRWGMAWIESYWPQLPAGLCWYAVGDATADALAGYGVRVQTPGGAMNSEALLDLPALHEVDGQRVLIVKGEGGRAALADALGRRGARVDELACYRRLPPQLAPGELASQLLRWRIDLVMLSSGEGLDNMLALLSPAETSKFIDMPLLVPSARVAQQAQAAGFRRIIKADNASDSAMLHALGKWQSTAGD